MSMSDGEDLFDDVPRDGGWAADSPWLSQLDDDRFELHLPVDAHEVLTAGLAHLADDVAAGVEIAENDRGRRRILGREELMAIVDMCADKVRYGLEHQDFTEGLLEEFAGAVSTMATVASADLEHRRLSGQDVSPRARWVDALDHLTTNCTTMLFTRFRPRRDGTFALRWHPADRKLIEDAVEELDRLLESDDPAIERLFPAPYGDDEERNAAWSILARSELIDRRRASLETVRRLMDTKRATAEELSMLMRTVNDSRLVFGTQLGITEPGGVATGTDEQRRLHRVYELLGGIVYDAVTALRSTL